MTFFKVGKIIWKRTFFYYYFASAASTLEPLEMALTEKWANVCSPHGMPSQQGIEVQFKRALIPRKKCAKGI